MNFFVAYFSCLSYLSGSSHSMLERITESFFFFGSIATCYRNLFGRLSGYSAWLVNELAFGVWLVAGRNAVDSLILYFFRPLWSLDGYKTVRARWPICSAVAS